MRLVAAPPANEISRISYKLRELLTYGLAAAGWTTFGYDAAGNQRIEQPPAGARTTTTWDYENQPTQYRLPTGSPVTMTYNADNRRVQSQQSTTVTKFVWDMPTDAYLSELNSASATQVVYTTEPVYYGSVISQRRGSTTHWLHADALGSTRILTTSAGATSDTYLYDAWGNPITSSGSTVNPFRWVGRYGYYFDTVTGLFYIRARTYQPTVARWMSVDPSHRLLHLRSNVPTQLYRSIYDTYTYCKQTALRRTDPSGNESLVDDACQLGHILAEMRSYFAASAECVRYFSFDEGLKLLRGCYATSKPWLATSKSYIDTFIGQGCVGVTCTMMGRDIRNPSLFSHCYFEFMKAVEAATVDENGVPCSCRDRRVFAFTGNTWAPPSTDADGRVIWDFKNGNPPFNDRFDFQYFDPTLMAFFGATGTVRDGGRFVLIDYENPACLDRYNRRRSYRVFCATCAGYGASFTGSYKRSAW